MKTRSVWDSELTRVFESSCKVLVVTSLVTGTPRAHRAIRAVPPDLPVQVSTSITMHHHVGHGTALSSPAGGT